MRSVALGIRKAAKPLRNGATRSVAMEIARSAYGTCRSPTPANQGSQGERPKNLKFAFPGAGYFFLETGIQIALR